jgi:hypothetical protein
MILWDLHGAVLTYIGNVVLCGVDADWSSIAKIWEIIPVVAWKV